MFLRLLLLFTILPFVELAILLWIALRAGWLATLGLVIGTGLVGAWLARQAGWKCLQAARAKLARGELPTDAILDGMLILAAGVALVTPGVLSDLAGLALLAGPLRRHVRRWLADRFRSRVFVTPGGPAPPDRAGDRVIDARVIDVASREPDER